jgi:hypothetical protein
MNVDPKFFQQSKGSHQEIPEEVSSGTHQLTVSDYPEYISEVIKLLRTLEGTAKTLRNSVENNKNTTQDYKDNFTTITDKISAALKEVTGVIEIEEGITPSRSR